MSDTTPNTRACYYCPKAGADVCIRMSALTPGRPAVPVFAHEDCAADHGVAPLYRVTDDSNRVVAFPWA
ncbi:hypothetical protein N4G70_28660 [Streptomyces sp. ASQP_92]|uniref:hypothetical protein n=1 Tax=Streptomyces sp. ASQP_92 TaxID=2979116 RepID=UPI0021C21418|nr:hypothetical protein [Streptomyces sp. ASQP_92]MCT9092812.1 hypothetical protein [Streptomyces sp. ASQP_92]